MCKKKWHDQADSGFDDRLGGQGGGPDPGLGTTFSGREAPEENFWPFFPYIWLEPNFHIDPRLRGGRWSGDPPPLDMYHGPVIKPWADWPHLLTDL